MLRSCFSPFSTCLYLSMMLANLRCEYYRVPQRYERLGRWINNQRLMFWKSMQKETSSMTSERVKMLDEVGFDWGHERRLTPGNSKKAPPKDGNSKKVLSKDGSSKKAPPKDGNSATAPPDQRSQSLTRKEEVRPS